jgi:hypothetical protein
MMKKVGLVVVSLVSLAASGATYAYAVTPSDAQSQLTSVCVPGLNPSCVSGICAAVSDANRWTPGQQATFGAAVAKLVSAEGSASPGDADKIQACIVSGPEALKTAFAQGGPPPVTDIGQNKPASAQ